MLRRSLYRFTPAFSEIFMPALSPSMESGTLVKWNTRIGDKICQGTSICSIQTDKAVVSFDHQMDDGFLAKMFAKEGDNVEVGKLIAILAEDEADVAKADEFKPKAGTLPGAAVVATPTPVAAASSPAAAPAASSPAAAPVATVFSTLTDAIAASGPAVARIAREVGEDKVAGLKPSGKNGRYTKGDLVGLEGAVAAPSAAAENPVATAPKAAGQSLTLGLQPGRVYDFSVSDAKILARLIALSPGPKASTVVKA